jgi:8-oxo-dGTP diphosphatase
VSGRRRSSIARTDYTERSGEQKRGSAGESPDHAARRELAEETGLEHVYIEELYTFGDPDRDPRGRVVTVACYALVRDDAAPVASGDAAAAA